MIPIQDQSQLDQQAADDKKFQMNVSAPVFQSMYAQVWLSSPPPPPDIFLAMNSTCHHSRTLQEYFTTFQCGC